MPQTQILLVEKKDIHAVGISNGIEGADKNNSRQADSEEEINKIRAQAEWLAATLNSIDQGIIAIDAEETIILANPVAGDYLSELTEARVGDKLSHLGGQSLQRLLQPLPAGKSWHQVVTEQAPRRAFEVKAQRLEAERDRDGWVLLIQEVTGQRALEAQRYDQERLAVAGQLAGGVAHYFNNLLTGIIGFAELIYQNPTITPSVKRDLKQIMRQGQRGAELIRQVMDFSGKTIVQKRPLDLARLLTETVDRLKPTLPEQIQISLKIEPDPKGYLLQADATQIRQALTNLALNAVEAMPSGGRLQFRLFALTHRAGERQALEGPVAGQVEGGPDAWMVLTVSDSGVGISPEDRPHVFEPFFTTKEVGQGLGLGLAQVYGIITQHEGSLEVESQVGQGSTFSLYLPRLVASQPGQSRSLAENIPYGHGQTVLLVEDQPEVLEVIEAMLKRLGYRVVTATNGQDALTLYDQEQQEIDLILTDILMPKVGGLSLIRSLRERNPDLKIAVLTGYPLDAEAAEFLSEGVVEWLLKPLNLQQLAQTVSRALQAS